MGLLWIHSGLSLRRSLHVVCLFVGNISQNIQESHNCSVLSWLMLQQTFKLRLNSNNTRGSTTFFCWSFWCNHQINNCSLDHVCSKHAGLYLQVVNFGVNRSFLNLWFTKCKDTCHKERLLAADTGSHQAHRGWWSKRVLFSRCILCSYFNGCEMCFNWSQAHWFLWTSQALILTQTKLLYQFLYVLYSLNVPTR